MSQLSNYTLGSGEPEHKRLIDLAAHEEDRVIDACRRAGVGEGATVIDAGCGPLGALAALARVVGETGSVIGVDGSSAAIEKARSLSLPPHVRLMHADVNEVALDANVDLVFSRLMLLHQRDPGATVRHLTTFLRPCGAFIAHEPSDLAIHAPASEPAVPAMTRVWELVIAAARSAGARTDFGRNGRAYLEAAGLRVESSRAYAAHYPPHIGYEIPRTALHSLRPALAAHALASEDELAQLDRELDTAKERQDIQWVSGPLMIEWIARRD